MVNVHTGPLGGQVICSYCGKYLTLESKTNYRHCVECNGEYDDNLKPINKNMEFQFPKPTISKFRLFLLRNGLAKPKSLQETREAFPFPNATHLNQSPKPKLWARHIELRYRDGGVRWTHA